MPALTTEARSRDAWIYVRVDYPGAPRDSAIRVAVAQERAALTPRGWFRAVGCAASRVQRSQAKQRFSYLLNLAWLRGASRHVEAFGLGACSCRLERVAGRSSLPSRRFVSRAAFVPIGASAAALGALVALGVGSPSCGDDARCEGAACGAQGGAQGGGGSAIAGCPDSGVLHGPWSLHFTETSAAVRWDACAPSAARIMVTPELGGASVAHDGEQTASDVNTSYDLINGVPPDLPGVYYRTEVEVTGLSPGICYSYQLEADKGRGGRFCTARAAGESFEFLAIGDTNPAVGDTAGVLDHTLDGVDFTIHLGDIQYYASVFDSWAAWFPAMAPMLEQGAFMPSVGNHEYEIDFEFQDYYARLFGGAGFDSTAVEWYRFQSGGVWFFSLSTESDLKAGSPQANWLEAQIADAASQPGYRFGVVYFHKPMMTLSEYSQKKSERLHFDPIFRQHGIKLILCGHVHGYERFVDGELTYIVSGGGGASLHDLNVSAADRPEEAALRLAHAEKYHGTVIEVLPDEIRGNAISHTGETLDSFAIALGGAGGVGGAGGAGGN
jgi:hypothetical protein